MYRQRFHLLISIILIGLLAGCEKETVPADTTYLVSAFSDGTIWTTKELGKQFETIDIDPTFLALLPNEEICIDKITYRTEDPHGNPVTASGLVTYPADGKFKGVIMGEHFTFTADREVPSVCGFAMESIYSLFGYAVVSPDYLGFGDSKSLTHPYLHVESAGRTSVDMLFAAREHMDNIKLPLGKETIAVGYSQGGACALAFQKMAEEEYPEEIPVLYTLAGGGPYDPAALFDELTRADYADYPCSVPLTILGLDYADRLKLDYAQLFREPLLSSYSDWYLSKEYTTGQINRLIGTTVMSDFMHPDMFTAEMNPEFARFYASLKANSLTGWTPRAPIWLMHGQADTYVTPVCARNAYEAFKAKGCTVELKMVDKGHKETGLLFYLEVINRLKSIAG